MDELDAMFGDAPGRGGIDVAPRSRAPLRNPSRSPWGNRAPPGQRAPPPPPGTEDAPNLEEMFDSGLEYKKREDGTFVPSSFSEGNSGVSLKDSMHPDLYAQLFPDGEPDQQG